MKNSTYQTLYAWKAIITGLAALGYAYFFVVAGDPLMYSICLLIVGLLSFEVAIALYQRLKDIHDGFAKAAVALAAVGAMGAAIHAGYDLANAINPPLAVNTDLPSQIDPRGLLAFGVTGLGILKISWLMSKDKYFPKGLSTLGFLSGTLLVVIYLARLTVLSPANPILLYPVLLEGFIVNPLWYLWLGWTWWNKK